MKAFSLLLLILAATLYSAQAQSDEKEQILWTCRWSPDGQWLAVGGQDGIVRLFDADNYELKKKFSLGSTIMRLEWNPADHSLLAVGAMESAALIDVSTDSVQQLGGKEEVSRGIAWNHDGSLLAGGHGSGMLTVWDKNGKVVRSISKGKNTYSYTALAWHPKSNQLITLSDSIRIYSPEGKLLKHIAHRKDKVLMLCLAWHPSGKFFALGDYGDYEYNYKAVLQFWEADGQLRSEYYMSPAEYRNIRWSPSGKRLATASEALRIWTKKGSVKFEGKSEDLLWGLDWHPDGKRIATSSIKGHIRIWDAKAKKVREVNWQ